MIGRHISIVWDFDRTLTPQDSTTEIIKNLAGEKAETFWDEIHELHKGAISSKPRNIEKLLASDAPTWMSVLARIAYMNDVVLDKEYFSKQTHLVNLFPGAVELITRTQQLSETPEYKAARITVHNFIVTAGLVEYIECLVPVGIVDCHWGCKYQAMYPRNKPDEVESVPIYCMDETMKTRAIFEIAKGVWNEKVSEVNVRVASADMWCPFENIIYVGDGPTDIPALSLIRDRGGYGIVVYDPDMGKQQLHKKLKMMVADERCDCIVPANYGQGAALETSIMNQCHRILQRYQVRDFV